MNKWSDVGNDLQKICPGRVFRNLELKSISRWRIGGPAALVVQPASVSEVTEVVRYVDAHGLPRVVIGECSNLLFSDSGLDALAIKIGHLLSSLSVDGCRMACESGVWVPYLVRRAALNGLGGLQHAIGIPGTLGGLICMNGGSQRKGIGDNIIDVTWISPQGEVRVLTRQDCGFGYRASVFQEPGGIVTGCTLELEPEDPRALRRELLTILKSRRERFPIRLPNCGSVFVSAPDMYDSVGPAGRVIEESGLKGFRIGDARFSHRHANFIVNLGCATAHDVLSLIRIARQRVYERSGFRLECEVRYVGSDGGIVPAHRALPDRDPSFLKFSGRTGIVS